MTKKRLNAAKFEELVSQLQEKPPTRRILDPHRRGRIIQSKKLYKRKPRMPSGVFHFWTGSNCHA